MNKYVAAALTVAIAICPASALEAGLGGKLGGVGVGAGLSAGPKGASVAGGSSVDGVGGVSLGGSLGAGKGSLGAGLGVSGNLGGASGGLSTGVGVGDPSSASGTAPGGKPGNPALGAGQAASSNAGITPATTKAKAASQFAILPRKLRPSGTGRNTSARITYGYPFMAPLKAKPGIPPAVVRACRTAIASAATPLGAVLVHAVSAGPLQQRRGALTAPIEVRIHYARQGGVEVRQARVGCRLDAAGRVTAVT
ncbi:hypothetical protein [Mesorhizobium muleiense]|uniref:Uncharacterized protein n=1 Tax=Mesorhizobium muleiense TaxID=1004279 RepID=A0A1G9HDJ1_9HYPH|nr:hypothetical protein [Mesorhizobium muleiense]MCF6099097.1 hypothetical protein [Mesorhizobium muleiense]SDL10969.1 hypothetical protein SAMN05428953_12722 [Mesorhizobium muleiense]